MHEVKKPKKPLIFYYAIVLAALLLFNLLAMPLSTSTGSKRWTTARSWA